MGPARANSLLCHIRRLLVAEATRESSDAQLLEQFSVRHDEQAFAAILQRHSALVWSVCRHILRYEQDVEDAFQATFLILARRAASIRRSESVGSWLYGVAHRVAHRSRKMAVQRERIEQTATARAAEIGPNEATYPDLQALVNEELRHLPEKYRQAFIACCLQGRSRSEAAAELGCGEGTLASRLARARKMLQTRLSRRGVAAAVVGSGLAVQESFAAVPPALTRSVLRTAALMGTGQPAASAGVSNSAAALVDATIRAMFMTKAKWAAGAASLLLLLGVLTAGAGLIVREFAPAGDASSHADKYNSAEAKFGKAAPVTERTQERVDRFGDALPDDAIARLGTIRLRHGASIHHLLFTMDGKTLISQGDDGVRTWDVETGKQRNIVAYRREYAVPDPWGTYGAFLRKGEASFSSDGTLLAMSTKCGTMLWSMRTGEHLRTVGKDPCWCVCLSPNGKLLATQQRKTYEVTFWDTSSGRLLRSSPGEKTPFTCMAFTPDAKTLIAFGRVASVIPQKRADALLLWHTDTAKVVRRIEAGQWNTSAVVVSPDGRLVASAGWEEILTSQRIRIWDISNGMELGHIIPPGKGRHWLGALAFSADGETVYANGLDGTLRGWDVRTGKNLHRVGEGIRSCNALAVSPDGRVIAIAGNSDIHFLEMETGKDRLKQVGHGWYVRVAALRSRIATSDGGAVIIWDPETGAALERFDAPAGRSMIVEPREGGSGVRREHDFKTNLFKAWDLATGKELPAASENGLVVLSGDGKIGAYSTPASRGDLAIRSLSTGEELRLLKGHGDGISFARFSSNGRALVVFGWDRKVHRWDLTTGRKLTEFVVVDDFEGGPRHIGTGLAIATDIAPDGGLIAFGTQTGLIAFHDLISGRRIRKLGKLADGTQSIAFSPDGRTLAWGGNTDGIIRFVEVATGGERRQFPGHQGSIGSIAFSPDGKKLISGSMDATALVWDLTGLRTRNRNSISASPKELPSLWQELARPDSSAAYRTMRTLWTVPDLTLPYFKQHLRPVAPVELKHLARLIADLASDNFTIRKKATAALIKLGGLAMPACRRALEQQSSLEVRRRIEAILEKQEHDWHSPAGDDLRALRALEILEMIGTMEAGRVLETLAGGAPDACLTHEAKLSVKRLKPYR